MYFVDLVDHIEVGVQGENLNDVVIDVSNWLEVSNNPSFEIVVEQPETGELYLADTERDGVKLIWHVQDGDVDVAGKGKCDIRMYDGTGDDRRIRKTKVVETIIYETIHRSISPDVPEAAHGWVDQVAANGLKAEGFAVGEQNGVPVEEGSQYYENNAKYYAESIEGSVEAAQEAALSAISAYTGAQLAAAQAETAKTGAEASATSAAASATSASADATLAGEKASAASNSATAAQTAQAAAETAKAGAESAKAAAASSEATVAASAAAAEAAKSAAQSAQSAAETAKAGAESAKAAAAGSATAAASSEATVVASVAAAEAAKSAAQSAQSAAETAKTNAQTAATNASASATAASTNATLASTKATDASNSATSAGNAKTAAEAAATRAEAAAESIESIEPRVEALEDATYTNKQTAWNQLNANTAATSTASGVTFTNNGDGTWTLTGNGTATERKQISAVALTTGHVYAVLNGGIDTTALGTYLCLTRNGSSLVSFYKEQLFVADIGYNQLSISTTSSFAAPEGGFVYAPMLIDLTAIYGAGNEPSTIAEFRAMYPHRIYPYAPIGSVRNLDITEVHGAQIAELDAKISAIPCIFVDENGKFYVNEEEEDE